jgi:hypothetical protein
MGPPVALVQGSPYLPTNYSWSFWQRQKPQSTTELFVPTVGGGRPRCRLDRNQIRQRLTKLFQLVRPPPPCETTVTQLRPAFLVQPREECGNLFRSRSAWVDDAFAVFSEFDTYAGNPSFDR